jgi:hypothetical protein
MILDLSLPEGTTSKIVTSQRRSGPTAKTLSDRLRRLCGPALVMGRKLATRPAVGQDDWS